MSNKYKDAFLGLAIGDALGVPYEFIPRNKMRENPITDMVGYGTHKQPAGTWSDDTSLTLCLASVLTTMYNTDAIAQSFLSWRDDAFWAARGHVFDIGNTTNLAITAFKDGIAAEEAGPNDESSNGNGALMRIMPIAFYALNMNPMETWDVTRRTASITHGHLHSQIACYLYVEALKAVMWKLEIHTFMKRAYNFLRHDLKIQETDLMKFRRVFDLNTFALEKEESINSGGYVIDTLEASLWCLLTSNSYKEVVLKAINLGDDTDTTAAVAGALAGMYFGLNVPNQWHHSLARRADIIDLTHRFEQAMVRRGIST